MSLQNFIRRKEWEIQQDVRFAKTWHSLFYHNQFEGFEEEKIPKDNGRGYRIVRTYTEKYYVQELTPARKILLRISYVLLFLLSSLIYGVASCIDVACNYVWYVSLPAALALPALVWLGVTFVSYIPSVKYIKIPDYKNGSCQLKKAARLSAALLGIAALMSIVSFVQLPESFEKVELIYTGSMLLAAGMIYEIWKMENGIMYSEIPAGTDIHI